MERLLYSIPEAAARLGRGKSTGYAMAASGELETVLLGSRRMVPADALEKLIGRLRAGSPSVQRLVDLIEDDGRLDVTRIPPGTTLADLEAAQRIVAERQVPA
ncbi:MAG: helix-turn-helix domain-containing protein [Acidimicrobiia bacterium]